MEQSKPLSNWVFYPTVVVLSAVAGIALEHFVLAEVIAIINWL